MKIERETLDGLEWVEPATPSSQIERMAWLSADSALQLGFPHAGLEWLDDKGNARPALLVMFRGGAVYAYAGAPVETLTGLVAADSPGRFMHLSVKCVYPYAKLEIEP